MRRALKLHPDSVCDAVTSIEVDVTRSSSATLALRYRLTGIVADLQLPAVGTAVRADELWRHTCFEAFARAPSARSYDEFNFAPSRQWAAYRFDSYRDGMRPADADAPDIEIDASDSHFALRVALPLRNLSEAPWQLGLSAIIEEANGRISYWALAHPPGKPDFHHPDCFALTLPPA